jgi:hypothetical protein
MKNNLLESKEGAKLFESLAEADPASALECLKRIISKWDRQKLEKFSTGRREVIWALEKIVVWRELFQEGARILLLLAEAENETWSNNATGIFKNLFAIGQGPVATTEASPQERFPILIEALASTSADKRRLALEACDEALEIGSHIRRVGPEKQGLKPEANLWRPKTWKELFDAYSYVWNLLFEKIDFLPTDQQQIAVGMLLRRSGRLSRISALSDLIMTSVKVLIKKPYINRLKALEIILDLLRWHKDKFNESLLKEWEAIRDQLTGEDFHSLLTRYVGISHWNDNYDHEGKPSTKFQENLNALARELATNTALFEQEIQWLLSIDAQNCYLFGYQLAKQDEKFSLLMRILQHQKTRGLSHGLLLLSGYFRYMFEKDKELWETFLDTLSSEELTGQWLLELTWRSGVTDRAALRVLSLCKKNVIKLSELTKVNLGFLRQDVSPDVFHQWIEFLIDTESQRILLLAMDWYGLYYTHPKTDFIQLPLELSLKLLLNPLWLQPTDKKKSNGMEDYYWAEITKELIKQYPNKRIIIADFILSNFGKPDTLFDSFRSYVNKILFELSAHYPDELWDLITKYLGPPIDTRAFVIQSWLSGQHFFEEEDGNLLHLFSPQKILKWIDEDPNVRSPYIARFIPKTLNCVKHEFNWVRELLIRYGDNPAVRSNLLSNFYTEGWTGEASLHYLNRKEKMINFRKNETNKKILDWIDSYLVALDKEIEHSKIEEERRY